MSWRIYYSDHRVDGVTEEDWINAPDDDMQVIVLMTPPDTPRWNYHDENGKIHVVYDRELWTGDDYFDPFGWGEKAGRLISDEEYIEIWRRACADT